MTPYRVIVVEDEPMILENIVMKIQRARSDFQVVYTAQNGLDAWNHLKECTPDLLITDIKMPVMDGLALLTKVKEAYPSVECVILTGYNEFEYARKAMKLGIQEYLLKPIKPESLAEILDAVEVRLSKHRRRLERDILVSSLYGSSTWEDFPSGMKKEHFAIFLVSLGHLCKQLSTAESLDFFRQSWKKADIAEILADTPNECDKWWIIDDRQPGQKFLILSFPAGKKPNLSELGNHLLSSILPKVSPLIVNLCTNEKLITYQEIWTVSQKLRLNLEHHLCLAESRLFFLDEASNVSPQKMSADYQEILLNLISTNNHRSLVRELEKLCRAWDNAGIPQRSVEKQFFQLVERAYHQFLPSSDAEIIHLEYEFLEKLALSPNLMGIFTFILEIFDNLLQLDENDVYDPEELVRRIRTFIEQNYMTPITLETIAQSFHFNSSYLTKIFKKYAGTTPLKYIIELRIQKAKKLMETQQELSIKDICTMVGYYDQHYFSRIFKNVTGVTPSDYRKKLKESGLSDIEFHI